jgi:hypothetical protein
MRFLSWRTIQMSHAAGRRNTSGRTLSGIGSGGWIGPRLRGRTGGAKREGEVFIFPGLIFSSGISDGASVDGTGSFFSLRSLNQRESRARCRSTLLPPIVKDEPRAPKKSRR